MATDRQASIRFQFDDNENDNNDSTGCIERHIFRFVKSHCAANCLQHLRSSGQDVIVCKSCSSHRVLISFCF